MRPPAPGPAWSAGLANQARREASMWWATSRWWRQAVVWSVVLGGLLAAVLWVFPTVLEGVEGSVAPDATEAAGQFTELAAVISAVGVVIMSQGLLLDDQRSGLVEWLLSKPLSRSALVLAKLAGHAGGLLFAVVAVPWVAVYALLSVGAGSAWPPGRFLGTVALIGLFVVFHVALVLALSALARSRGVVLAVPLALLVGSDVIVGLAPWAADGMPWLLGRIAAALLATGTLVAVWPVVATAVGTVALTALAVGLFGRQEL